MGLFRRIRKRAQARGIYSELDKKYIEGVMSVDEYAVKKYLEIQQQTDEYVALLEAEQGIYDDVDPPPSRLSVEDLLG